MGSFIDDLVLHTGKPVKDHGAGASFDIVYGRLRKGPAKTKGYHPLVDVW